MAKVSPWPSRKWWATQVTAVTGLIIGWISTRVWNQQLSITFVTLIGQALVGYLTPNLPSPAETPDAKPEPVLDGRR